MQYRGLRTSKIICGVCDCSKWKTGLRYAASEILKRQKKCIGNLPVISIYQLTYKIRLLIRGTRDPF